MCILVLLYTCIVDYLSMLSKIANVGLVFLWILVINVMKRGHCIPSFITRTRSFFKCIGLHLSTPSTISILSKRGNIGILPCICIICKNKRTFSNPTSCVLIFFFDLLMYVRIIYISPLDLHLFGPIICMQRLWTLATPNDCRGC